MAETMVLRWNGKECPDCKELTILELGEGAIERCHDCTLKAAELARVRTVGLRLMARLPEVVTEYLTGAGMSKRELASRLDKVPQNILHVLQKPSAQSMLRGELPVLGFGMTSLAGHGKTCALASVVAHMTSARFLRELPKVGMDALRPWLLWLSWPETVNRLRVMSTRDGGIQHADDLIQHACTVDLLVLDDIGGERVKGSYTEDWTASQLDLVIDARYREQKPILYTTSLTRARLVSTYGQRIYSRLVGDNPLYEIAPAKDLRLGGTP